MPRLDSLIFALTGAARKTPAFGPIVALTVLYLVACSSGAGVPADSGGSGGTAGQAGSGSTTSVSLSLRAVSPTDGLPIDTNKLAAGQSVKLIATAIPAVTRPLRFALVGDAFDAALDVTDVPADSLTGAAEVMLTAPSRPSAFGVRVSTASAEPAVLPLVVPETGFATLDVWASYGGGRPVKLYTATAWENKTCADLQGAPPEDGEVSASSATFPVALQVKTGVPLAVILRGGNFVWGCETVDAAQDSTLMRVDVPLANVPIRLDRSHIRVDLDLEPTTPLVEALVPSRDAILTAMLGRDSDDIDALLNAMEDSLDDSTAFRSTRRAEKWDSTVRSAVPNGGEALRQALGGWIAEGVEAMSFDEAVVGDLKGIDGSTAPPVFTLRSVLGLEPAVSTFASAGPASWSSQADDSVLIGMSLAFDPTGLLLGVAMGSAKDEHPETTDLGLALSATLSCTKVAETLVEHGESSMHSSDGCDQECTEALCQKGVQAILARASVPLTTKAKLDIGLTGSGSVGDDASLVLLSGRWLGKLAISPVGEPDEPSPSATIDLNGFALAEALP